MLIFITNDHKRTLSPDAGAVLAYLGVSDVVRAVGPSLVLLDALVTAYTQRIPWESASRIVRRARHDDFAACPRWPDTFWRDAMQHGTGGTCFESNYAFFWLLRELGFDGDLTVNDMGDAQGCHSALVIRLAGRRYLVDVGLPVYLPLPLEPTRATRRDTPQHTYTLAPAGGDRYTLTRDRHPRPDCFTLVDAPVDDAAYRAVTTADYGPDGLFLDRVIVNRVVDGVIWRFSGEGPPYHLEAFAGGDKTYHLLGFEHRAVAVQVAARFGMEPALLAEALALTARDART